MSIISFRKTDFLPASSPSGDRGLHHIVIAVDGPAASGKGTLAKKLADRLGYAYLDTGALYRAVAMATLEIGGDPALWADVEPALNIIKRNLTPELLSNPLLRTPDVSEAASKVAALSQVRQALLEYQRNFALNPPGPVGGAVLDGRDIGTVVCPKADIKFFVTASLDERARRRHAELSAKEDAPAYDTVFDDIKRRDTRDQSRSIAPTLAADDAYILDTTGLSPAQTLEEAIAVIRAQFLAETNDNTGAKTGAGGSPVGHSEKMAL